MYWKGTGKKLYKYNLVYTTCIIVCRFRPNKLKTVSNKRTILYSLSEIILFIRYYQIVQIRDQNIFFLLQNFVDGSCIYN